MNWKLKDVAKSSLAFFALSAYKMIWQIGFLALVIIGLTISSPVSATTGTLNITTDTKLTEDHFGNITIGANGITLDCNGFNIRGSGSGIGIFLANRTDVTVKECHVSNFSEGFRLNFSSDNFLRENTASNNFEGFRLNFSSNNFLKRNTANNSRSNGFAVGQSSVGNILKENIAKANAASGIALGRSNDNIIRENISNGNGDNGFGLVLSDGNTLEKNIANNNGTGNAGARAGFAFGGANNNTFTENTAKRNTGNGFDAGPSNNNTFRRNTANVNGGFGYADRSSGTGTAGTANTYLDNKCKNNDFGGSAPTELCSPQI